MNNQRAFVNVENKSLYSIVSNLITKPNYVNVATIKNVSNEDFVDVSLFYVGDSGEEVVITDVRLLHLGTDKCKVIVEPEVGDYVLLLTPKDFVTDFEFQSDRIPESTEVAYPPYGNANACGILVKADGDDNVNTSLLVDQEGNITVRGMGTLSMTKTDSDDEPLLSLNVDEEGNVTIEGEGTATSAFKGDVEKSTEGSVSVTVKGDAAVSVDGNVDIEATQTGLITIKNSVDSLGALLAALIDQVNTFSQNVQSIDTVGSPASHSAGPGIIANMVSLQAQLAQLKQKAGQVLG